MLTKDGIEYTVLGQGTKAKIKNSDIITLHKLQGIEYP